MDKLERFANMHMVITVLAMIFTVIVAIGICTLEWILAEEIEFNGIMIGYSLVIGYAGAWLIVIWNWIEKKFTKKWK